MKYAFGHRLEASRSMLVDGPYAINCLLVIGDNDHGSPRGGLPIRADQVVQTRSNAHTASGKAMAAPRISPVGRKRATS